MRRYDSYGLCTVEGMLADYTNTKEVTDYFKQLLRQSSAEKKYELMKTLIPSDDGKSNSFPDRENVLVFNFSWVGYLAIKSGHMDLMEVLLENTTQQQWFNIVKLQQNYRNTALLLSVTYGLSQIVQQKLAKLTQPAKFDLIRMADEENWTVLHLAAAGGRFEIVKDLLEGFTQQERFELIRLQNDDGWTALHLSARYGHTEIITHLLEGLNQQQRFDLVQLQTIDKLPVSSMMAGSGDKKATKDRTAWCRQEEAKLMNEKMWTALNVAAAYNHTEAVRQLMKDLTQQQRFDVAKLKMSGGSTMLHVSAGMGHKEAITQLKKHLTQPQMFEVAVLQNVNHLTALHFAIGYGHTEVVKQVLEDMTQQQRHSLLTVGRRGQNTAVHLAIQLKDVAIILGMVFPSSFRHSPQFLSIEYAKFDRAVEEAPPTDLAQTEKRVKQNSEQLKRTRNELSVTTTRLQRIEDRVGSLEKQLAPQPQPKVCVETPENLLPEGKLPEAATNITK